MESREEQECRWMLEEQTFELYCKEQEEEEGGCDRKYFYPALSYYAFVSGGRLKGYLEKWYSMLMQFFILFQYLECFSSFWNYAVIAKERKASRRR